MNERDLMRNLMRAAGAARRHPAGESGQGEMGARQEGPRPGRGFGHVLDMLAGGQQLSQQQIAEQLGIRPQSVSEAVKALEERGYVRREPSIKDRRATVISITEQGLVRREELAEERRIRAEKFFSVLDEEEKEMLLGLLMKLNEGAQDKKGEF